MWRDARRSVECQLSVHEIAPTCSQPAQTPSRHYGHQTVHEWPFLIVLYVGVLCWSLCHDRLRRQARWLMQRGWGEKGGCLAELPPWPRRRREGKSQRRCKAAGANGSYQLSGVSWVSMSTLQMGHFLLVASHWSTHAWWKRCMHGNLLQTKEIGFMPEMTQQ